MAHHLAIHGSRFCYSHDSAFLPAHATHQILCNLPVKQRFVRVRGKSFPFNSTLYFLHCPKQMERMCMYKFFMDMEFVSKSEAEKSGKEYFLFDEKHPCLNSRVAIYRNRECVPVFAWNWLKSTKQFGTDLFADVSESDGDYNCKEEYAFKFMILFLPFRKKGDLQIDGSYQKRFQKAIEESEFHPHMLEVGENIQNIHNSLQSTMPENCLSAQTLSSDLENVGNGNEELDGESNYLWNNIDSILRIDEGEKLLEKDSEVLNLQHCGKVLSEQLKIPPKEFQLSSTNSIIEITPNAELDSKEPVTSSDTG